MIVDVTGVNFMNIYLNLLHQYFCAKKVQSQNVTREKLRKALSYKKIVRKMLMKLTPVYLVLKLIDRRPLLQKQLREAHRKNNGTLITLLGVLF